MNNGYTTIEIDGKSIGIKFGLPAKQWLMKKIADNPDLLDSGDGGLNAAYAATILYTGYRNWCVVKEVKGEHSFEFFLNFIETFIDTPDNKEKFDEVINVWSESVEIKRVIQQSEEVKKKNGVPMKSKPIATDALA